MYTRARIIIVLYLFGFTHENLKIGANCWKLI